MDYAGLTETCGASTCGFPYDMCMLGTVGSVNVYNELHLEEVSEMGYNPLGDPPCGEICLRGKTIFPEYYKNPGLTREAIVDGWLHTGKVELFSTQIIFCLTFSSKTQYLKILNNLNSTPGDIGQMLPNGTLKIIDRKKNLIKLSQGEYIALEHLENVYGITPIVEDVSICFYYAVLYYLCSLFLT